MKPRVCPQHRSHRIEANQTVSHITWSVDLFGFQDLLNKLHQPHSISFLNKKYDWTNIRLLKF